MTPDPISIRKTLNKAYLKIKPVRSHIELFKSNISELYSHINFFESEEHHKNIIAGFLRNTYYEPDHYINTKGRTDLVIHNGKNSQSSVGVIIETKRPGNKAEMPTRENLNAKAVHELLLYYLRERITCKNLELKHIIVTDLNEWFIFNAQEFEKLFASNKKLVKDFEQFEERALSGTKTDFFYNEIAKPFLKNFDKSIQFTWFDLSEFKNIISNPDKKDDTQLIGLYKIFSPEHLLKLPFSNDSNTLDRRFYNELLHIIGLEETKDGGKKLIGRKAEKTRNLDSLLENTVNILKHEDSLNQLQKPSEYGSEKEEQLFSLALELCITWINRILFLKLLEGQLMRYHNGDEKYKFLNPSLITDFDTLNKLFFHVLAVKEAERSERIMQVFGNIPYLNSSLFEPSDLEHKTIRISNLDDNGKLPVLSSTVLKDNLGNKVKGEENTLHYLLKFLDAYDFSSEGKEEISEENKTLINASVLGLIFEKINGYKDGSFFTPGFITMYMCRETIRRAVVQKFNDVLTPLLRAGGVSPLPCDAGGTSRRTIIPYNPKLKQYARELRNKSTKSEILLWTQLKGKFEGKYDFHRQKPLDNYIADFFCYELKLVIEIDGETHNWEKTQQKDYNKECNFNELGLNVLRFTDDDVFSDLDGVINTISSYIAGYEKGDLKAFRYKETPLNPLSGGEPQLKSGEEINIRSEGSTHPQPLSRGETHPQPLSRGELSLPETGNDENTAISSIDELYNYIGEGGVWSRKEANAIINSLKICDPAVGSGHFLVSALNEIIAIKSELKILADKRGKVFRDYHVEVINDELVITDEEGEFFEYHPKNPESQRIQETLFHEKQTIIENCLFGVDINQNSVKICRLRLWIELLKNAYYKVEATPLLRGAGGVSELETLPNIDINIKCGNSLISRYPLDADIKKALQRSKWSIDSYRAAVMTYRNAENKEEKASMRKLIDQIKNDFESEVALSDKRFLRMNKLKGELTTLTSQTSLFALSQKEKDEWNKKVKKITDEITKIENELEEIKNNKIYEHAFEWRFEFPEVLNDDGEFVGFDVVIGNPPYTRAEGLEKKIKEFYNANFKTAFKQYDILVLFFEKGIEILKNKYPLSFIVSNKFLISDYGAKLRQLIIYSTVFKEAIDISYDDVFKEASVYPYIISFNKESNPKDRINNNIIFKPNLFEQKKIFIPQSSFTKDNFIFDFTSFEHGWMKKIEKDCILLGDILKITRGFRPPKEELKNQKQGEKYLIGSDIKEAYHINWSGNAVVYQENEIEESKPLVVFKQEKVLFRDIGLKFNAVVDDLGFLCLKTIYFGYSETKEYDLKFITAILNSTLMNRYFSNKYSIAHIAGGYLRFRKQFVENIPIKITKRSEQQSLSKIVEKIISLKHEGKETSKEENQIDQLVYELYGLTEEEIRIVEEAVL